MIELILPYPVSSNRYWRSFVPRGGTRAITVLSDEAKAYKEQVQWIASRVIKAPLTGRLLVHMELYPHRPQDWQARMRKHGETWDDTVQCIDLGNCEKVTSDALQGIVYADDCKHRRIVLERMEPDDKGARLVVRIEQMALQAPQLEIAA